MRKFTLFLSLLVTMITTAMAQSTLEFTFNRSDEDATVTVSGAEDVTATIVATSPNPQSNATKTGIWNTGNEMGTDTNILCTSTNTSAATADAPITYTLTITGLDNSAVCKKVVFTHVTANANGYYQPNTGNGYDTRHCNFILKANGVDVATQSDVDIWIQAASGNTGKDIAFEDLEFNPDNGTVTLTLTIYKGTTNAGCFYGLKKIVLETEAAVPAFGVAKVTPSEAVESLNNITIEFTKDITVDWGTDAGTGTGTGTGTDNGTGGTGTGTIAAAATATGTGTDGTGTGTDGTGTGSVSSIKVKDTNGGNASTIWTSQAYVDGKTITFKLESAITKSGVYTVEIPAGCIKSIDGEEYTGGTFTFTVDGVPAMTSKTTANVENTLSNIVVEFDSEVEFAAESDVTVLNVLVQNTETIAGTITVASNAVINGNTLTLTLDEAIVPEATTKYTVEIPAGWIVKKSNGKAFAGTKLTYTVKVPFVIKGFTPASGSTVEIFESIAIEYNGNVDTYGKKVALKNVENGKEIELQVAKNANIATLTCDVYVPNGTYELINLGYIVDKSTFLAPAELPEYTITVNAPVATLNETVVFDFVNGGWNIPTMEENNFSSIKTAGEYTDGAKTINIDPTANGGSYIYDSKGFLNISKPGTKIILPAFGFAVEKIEVVGHSSGTSYANVDMNVYVGEDAVSTACIGTAATSTFEIAADNQAAGNVYELVIGSNGGNYSSVMYITYIKVYPAENKLEAPVIDLASGVYVGAQTVNVHSATADIEGVTNVTYYYTTDGNEPTVEDEETDGEITITESCTLKVIVELTYGDKTYVSASTSAEYIISEAVTYHRAVAVESGNYFLAANGHVAAPLANGVLPGVETTIDGNDLTEAAYYAITLEETAEGGTYYIKDVNGNYIYTSSMYGTSGPKLSSNGAYVPMSSWTITVADDENSTATIVSEGLTLVYDTVAGAFKVTETVSDGMILPTFYGTHATGIENIVTNGEAIESIYDLQGRKLEKVTEGGIYIVNGKKILVK